MRNQILLPNEEVAHSGTPLFLPRLLGPHPVAGRLRRRAIKAKVLLGLLDLAVVAVAMVVAFLLRAQFKGYDERTAGKHLLVGLCSMPVWAAFFARYSLYTSSRVTRRLEEFNRVVSAVAMSVFAIAFGTYMLDLYVRRSWLLVTGVVAIFLVTIERELVRRAFWAVRERGKLMRQVVIVGTNVEAQAIATMLGNERGLGYDVLGFLADDDGFDDCHLPDDLPPVLGRVSEVLEIVGSLGVRGVIVARTAVDSDLANLMARRLTDAGLYVQLSTALVDIAPERLAVRALGRYPTLSVEPVPRTGWRVAAKRGLDVFGAVVAIVILFPMLALIAIAIKLESRGPVLFRQERVGKDGKPFSVWKFRTMIVNAEAMRGHLVSLNEADGPLFKLREDPRVTRVGKILRALSLDELPQIWNVLRSQMSLVGPRPALPSEVPGWSQELHERLRVKPGITGMWQVSGRSDLSFDDYARLDLYYVDNWSLLTDLAIVAKTVPSILLRRGAY
jgi:exopolysaccharide biosynthesis polyprenyl glycosylphosphotransferase